MYRKIKSLENFCSTRNPTYKQSQYAPTTNFTLENMTTVPYGLNGFQIQPYQVWNFDGVGFDQNGDKCFPDKP